MTVIAVTGNLGSGKTTVSRMFAEHGAVLIDADAITHKLLDTNRACQKRIKAVFGNGVFDGEKIDRTKLAATVFEDADALQALEDIIHPRVRREIKKRLSGLKRAGNYPMCVLEVPLLFETNMETLADAVIVVRSNQKLQIGRVIKEGKMTRIQAMARLKRQMSQDEKLRQADFIIDNRRSKQDTRAQVRRIFDTLVHHT